MLSLKKITKDYVTANSKVSALRGVSVDFRDNEFVAILGQSGCGKTTLLNIIGGLDRYTDGDLIINGRSTDDYSDADWDSYRNHSVGFVFQSYNLIPHQTVLSNVELALTLSGVSKAERRRRASQALASVGLEDQLDKRPNQLSGGQMQRVAIARALVNNPDILLADEPTGALDTETSVQVMDILREVASDRLVIMVTHNPGLAEQYATRTVQLLDGVVVSDSNPMTEEEIKAAKPDTAKVRNTSMSLGTALSLSLNNLMTKKARTILTAVAGSIGIIGIALILSMSNGFQRYIDRVQQDTLSTYPLQISSESMDMTGLISAFTGADAGEKDTSIATEGEIHSVDTAGDIYSALQSQIKNNDLEAFYKYMQEHDEEIKKLTSAVQYRYDISIYAYNTNSSFGTTRVNPSSVADAIESSYSGLSMFMGGGQWDVWTEMIDNPALLEEQYDVVSGRWPQAYNEVVLFIGENNEIDVLTLYTLGILDQKELAAKLENVAKGEKYEEENIRLKFEDVVYNESDGSGWSFRFVPEGSFYKKNADGTWTDMRQDAAYIDNLAKDGELIKVVGIAKPSESAVAGSVGGAIGYTSALTDYVIALNGQSEARNAMDIDDGDILAIINGGNISDAKKAAMLAGVKLSDEEIAEMLAIRFADYTQEQISTALMQKLDSLETEKKNELMIKYAELFGQLSSGSVSTAEQMMELAMPFIVDVYRDEFSLGSGKTEAEAAQQFDVYAAALKADGRENELISLYRKYCLPALTEVDIESPTDILIYPTDFESKERLSEMIKEYNDGQTDENKRISYTDYIGLFISSISVIIDTISYVLIGFVSISLFVSSIMIGVITYISVLERTKEIGILRSIGASKHDIRMVFNAETFIIGAISGLLGIAVTLLAIIPVNMIIKSLSGIVNIAALPFAGGVILVLISIVLTVVAGLIPSVMAAKRDPVVALRTE